MDLSSGEFPPNSKQSMTCSCFVRDRSSHRYSVEFITENDADYRNAAELQDDKLAAMNPPIRPR